MGGRLALALALVLALVLDVIRLNLAHSERHIGIGRDMDLGTSIEKRPPEVHVIQNHPADSVWAIVVDCVFEDYGRPSNRHRDATHKTQRVTESRCLPHLALHHNDIRAHHRSSDRRGLRPDPSVGAKFFIAVTPGQAKAV